MESGNSFKALILLVIINASLWMYYNQKFSCDRAKNYCVSTMSGIRISKPVAISDIKSATIDYNQIAIRGKHSGTTNTDFYMPVLIMKSSDNIDFYKSSSTNMKKVQEDIYELALFLKGSGSKLELKNKDTMYIVFAAMGSLMVLGLAFNKLL